MIDLKKLKVNEILKFVRFLEGVVTEEGYLYWRKVKINLKKEIRRFKD